MSVNLMSENWRYVCFEALLKSAMVLPWQRQPLHLKNKYRITILISG